MGKGSNVQKKQQAQLRNAKDKGKTEEERKVSAAKAKKDQAAFMCAVCRQTFMVNARPPLLYQHVVAKHPAGTDPASCFEQLKDYDPNDPNKEEKKSADAEALKAKKEAAAKKNADLDNLLDSGLKKK